MRDLKISGRRRRQDEEDGDGEEGMRTKSFPARARPGSSRRLRKPAILAASFLNEATEEHNSESDEPNATYDHHGDTGDRDVEIVPDSFDERDAPPNKRLFVGTSDAGKGFDSLNSDACIICGIADDRVLPCSGIDCPISLHGKCVNPGLDDEDVASSYCPYCWFKNQLLRSKALREKAVVAEKALLNYLGKEMTGGDKEKESTENVHDKETSLSSGENGSHDRSKGSMDIDQLSDRHVQVEEDVSPSRDQHVQSEEGIDQSRDQHVQLNEEIDQLRDQQGQSEADIDQLSDQNVELEDNIERLSDQHMEFEEDEQNEVCMAEQNASNNLKAAEGQQQEDLEEEKAGDTVEASESEERLETEKWQDAEDGKEEEAAKDQQKGAAGKEKNGDASPFLSIQETFSGKESEQAQSKAKRKRWLKSTEQDSNISSNESTNDRNGQSIGSSKTSSSRQATSPIGNKKIQKRKSATPKATNRKRKSATPKATKLKRKTSFVKNDKRKRLLWTPEEEEMLRVGVEKFSSEVNKNIPWRKILEMGEGVFDETRTPTDLKDKWRNISGKK